VQGDQASIVGRALRETPLRLVLGLQGHRLTVLHLNMSSAGHMVLYSFSLKVCHPQPSSYISS
jgi:hypothetical protein